MPLNQHCIDTRTVAQLFKAKIVTYSLLIHNNVLTYANGILTLLRLLYATKIHVLHHCIKEHFV
jgi:hypothetical protein